MRNRVENTAVVISSQDELDKVDKWEGDGPYATYEHIMQQHPNSIVCRNIGGGGSYSRLTWYDSKGYTILTFKEFEEMYLHNTKSRVEYPVGIVFKALVDKANGIPDINKGDLVEYLGGVSCKVLKSGVTNWSMNPHDTKSWVIVTTKTINSNSPVKNSDYRVGDTVKLVSERPSGWNSAGGMDRYLGLVVKINSIAGDKFTFEGYNYWNFFITRDIEKLISRGSSRDTKAELLAEAYRRYPKGTKFKSALSPLTETVNTADDTMEYKAEFGGLGKVAILTDRAGWCVYFDGKWAEVITNTKLTEPEYKIGDWVIASIKSFKYIGVYNGKNELGKILLSKWKTLNDPGSEYITGGQFDKIIRSATREQVDKAEGKSKNVGIGMDTTNNITTGTMNQFIGKLANLHGTDRKTFWGVDLENSKWPYGFVAHYQSESPTKREGDLQHQTPVIRRTNKTKIKKLLTL